MSDPVARRERRAVESILENERLTGDLDDLAAQSLIDWGLACVKQIAQSTAGMGDQQAEETMSARADATQRMMRLVQRSATAWQQLDRERKAELLDQIIEQAAIAYGNADVEAGNADVEAGNADVEAGNADFRAGSAPSLAEGQREALLRQLEQEVSLPAQMIVDVRLFIENLGHTARPTGGRDDEKERDEREPERPDAGHHIEPVDARDDRPRRRRQGKWWRFRR